MGGDSNEGEMGFKHGDDENGISRIVITSMPLYSKVDPFFSSADWEPLVSGINSGGDGFSSSHYPSMAMSNPGMSCFPHYPPGSCSAYSDMPTSLLHQVSDDDVLGASHTRKRRQSETESQWNKKAVDELHENPQKETDQSQKKHKTDQSNENYIHMRARRGQATNSHSLAERVRREKISERMKLLQEIVPGCNKITGKAVMLDEIINYVQSLQQQVEFLSMKLATVNPELNIDIDKILSKEHHFSGIQGTNLQYNPLTQASIGLQTTLESELQSLYQMGLVSNPSVMSSFSPNGRLKPEM